MTKECELVWGEFAMNEEDYRAIYMNSVEAAFASDEVKDGLRRYL